MYKRKIPTKQDRLYKLLAIQESKAIKQLKQGDDSAIRQYYDFRIQMVLAQSQSGLIGWGNFVEEIENLISKMKEQCEEHWPR